MTDDETVAERSLGRTRHRIVIAFIGIGLIFGSWVPRVPAVKAALHLSSGHLGIALLAPALGSLASMSITGAVVAAGGSPVTIRCAFLAFCLPPGFIGLTHSLGELFVVLLIWGAGIGAVDVAVNSQAIFVQDAMRRPVMSGFHAWFSIGGLLGGGLGSLAAGVDLPVDVQLGVTSVVVFVAVEWAAFGMLDDRGPRGRRDRRFIRPDRELVLLGALGFAAMLCEGSASDWSAVYLRLNLGASPATAGLGFVGFSVAMIVGRLCGDRLTVLFGAQRLFRCSCLFAGVGLALGLGLDTTFATILGFTVLGFGIACCAPLLFAAAGRHEHPGPSVATVTSESYLGFLAGPSMIGAIASFAGLRLALGIIPLVAVVLAGGAGIGVLD